MDRPETQTVDSPVEDRIGCRSGEPQPFSVQEEDQTIAIFRRECHKVFSGQGATFPWPQMEPANCAVID